MTKCKECGHEISTTADACPKCGAKQVRTSGCAKVVLVFLGLIVFLAAIGQCGRESTNTATTSASSSSSGASAPSAATPIPTPPPVPEIGSQWIYSVDEDQMAKGTTHHAIVQSTNTVEFGFPYAGPQHGMLGLRTHPRHGKDVIFKIERGQILCRPYEDCTVLVRFDDGKAQSYSGVGAADNSTETIFIRNYSRFVSAMMKAKTVRIAADVYQEGAPVFEFDVSGFDEAKYKGTK
jgi:hypothetical protein